MLSLGDWQDRTLSQMSRSTEVEASDMPLHYSAAKQMESIRTKHLLRGMLQNLTCVTWEQLGPAALAHALAYGKTQVRRFQNPL